jgi:hypothetical protein
MFCVGVAEKSFVDFFLLFETKIEGVNISERMRLHIENRFLKMSKVISIVIKVYFFCDTN